MQIYAGLGITDYFLCDIEGLYLPTPLMGFTLVDGRYEPVPQATEGGVHSAVIGLTLHLQPDTLQFYDPAIGQWLQTPEEIAEARTEQETLARQQAEARTEQETLARQQARRQRRRRLHACAPNWNVCGQAAAIPKASAGWGHCSGYTSTQQIDLGRALYPRRPRNRD